MSKKITAVLIVAGFVIVTFVLVFAWPVFQWKQCRHNPQNTFWFCVGHL